MPPRLDISYNRFRAPENDSHWLILASARSDAYEPPITAKRLVKMTPKIPKRGKVTVVPVLNRSALTAARTGEDIMDRVRICPANMKDCLYKAAEEVNVAAVLQKQ